MDDPVRRTDVALASTHTTPVTLAIATPAANTHEYEVGRIRKVE
jgi:hypothetical protein